MRLPRKIIRLDVSVASSRPTISPLLPLPVSNQIVPESEATDVLPMPILRVPHCCHVDDGDACVREFPRRCVPDMASWPKLVSIEPRHKRPPLRRSCFDPLRTRLVNLLKLVK